jgi:hypothetical protein
VKFESFPNSDEEKNKDDLSRREFLTKGIGAAIAAGLGVNYLDKKTTNVPVEEEIIDEPARYRDDVVVIEKEEIIDEPAIRREVEQYQERENIDWKDFKKIKPELSYQDRYVANIENLNYPDSVGKYGASTHEGKILRTLRYKNITDAVEERYNLPPGVLLAMIMEESTGVDLLPNARGDGGFGLSHMQGSVAREYGLKTFDNCNSLVCGPKKGSDGKLRIVGCKDSDGHYKNHGKALSDFMKNHADDRKTLVEADERLHILLNIDAAGRMLATGIAGPRINGLGSFRTAICRYAGKYNYEKYWADIKRNMRDVTDSNVINELADNFNTINRDLIINGKKSNFFDYMQSCYNENENYDLSIYKKMTKYRPENSDGVLKSYQEFINS